jgi:hypothetical protein
VSNRVLFACQGGFVVLPDAGSTLVNREDGGQLIVNPPRPVWERSELDAEELMLWSFLVAATARAMIDVLPQLKDGCINYWEAGNWALNDAAEPVGHKSPRKFRNMHLHLLGRSPSATSPAWRWGESPKFPDFKDRAAAAATASPLRADECREVLARAANFLTNRYGLQPHQIAPWAACADCGYPALVSEARPDLLCLECSADD